MTREALFQSPLLRLLLVAIVVFAALPFLGGYGLNVAGDLVINVLIVVSFRFISTMGKWSFAHVPLAGAGGYTSAILTTQLGMSFWVSLLVGGVVAGAVAFIISIPTLRTKDFYFFMSTFAAGALIVWTWNAMVVPFGGTTGLYGVRPPSTIAIGEFRLGFSTPLEYTRLIVVVTAISMGILLRLEGTRFGMVLKAIRWQTPLASSIGLNVRRYETWALVIGSAFAGIAGVLFVHKHGIAFPNDWGTLPGITIVMFTVVGGAERFWGPPLGVLVMTVIAQGIQQYPELVPYVPLVFGALTIAIVLTSPEGLVAWPNRIRRGLRNFFSAVLKRQGASGWG